MNRLEITRRRTFDTSGRVTREEYTLLASEVEVYLFGGIIRLGGRKKLAALRREIDRYLNAAPDDDAVDIIPMRRKLRGINRAFAQFVPEKGGAL
jgi:hypothetical protein